jgi:hypothetical protein
MSDHYEVVFACFLRDDTPDDVLDALRWHLGLLADRPASLDPDEHDEQRLLPDPDTRLPGREFVELRRQERGYLGGETIYEWGRHAADDPRHGYDRPGLPDAATVVSSPSADS